MKNSEINIDDFWKSKELLTAYSEDNYKVVDLSGKSKTCIIFFSSNGLYYPNEVKTLKKEIINNDYYEWLNVSKSVRIQRYAKRIIYVRDIYKQWYVVGINCRYNTIEKTTELLEYLSDGYEIITVGGGSSGGYAAIIFGIKLNAKRIYSFSGQFHIWDGTETYFLLNKYKNNKKYSDYYDLKDIIKEHYNIPIYHFYPKYCEGDESQYDYVKDITNIFEFTFNYSTHAKTLIGCNYQYILIMNDKQLEQLYRKCKGKLLNQVQFLWISVNKKVLFNKKILHINRKYKKFKRYSINKILIKGEDYDYKSK